VKRLATQNLLCLLFVIFVGIRGIYASAQIVAPVGAGASSTNASSSTNGIEYHGGPIIPNPHVYFIWYGNWTGNTALTILPQLISGLSGSPYFNINTTYSDSTGASVTNSVSMRTQVFDSYSQGTVLSDQGLQAVVSQQLTSGGLPTDNSGIYFVLTSADVDESGIGGEFCFRFCGFHTRALLNGSDIKYAFVGNIDRCPNACAASNLGPGPNGNAGADAMANVIVHELSETVTDPDMNAWFHGNLTGEVGDLCNFNFGPEFITSNGAPANVTLGGRNYLIQQNWLNANGGLCTMSFSAPGSPDFSLSVSPNVETIFGGVARFTVALSPLQGSNGVYKFSTSGLPPNAFIAFNPPQLTDSGSTTLSITGLATGTYNITFNVSNSVSPPVTHVASMTLVVAPATLVGIINAILDD